MFDQINKQLVQVDFSHTIGQNSTKVLDVISDKNLLAHSFHRTYGIQLHIPGRIGVLKRVSMLCFPETNIVKLVGLIPQVDVSKMNIAMTKTFWQDWVSSFSRPLQLYDSQKLHAFFHQCHALALSSMRFQCPQVWRGGGFISYILCGMFYSLTICRILCGWLFTRGPLPRIGWQIVGFLMVFSLFANTMS